MQPVHGETVFGCVHGRDLCLVVCMGETVFDCVHGGDCLIVCMGETV